MSARKTPLRAVTADEKPPEKPKSITEAASSGTHRELLVAMRDRVAQTVQNPDCPPRDLASLTRRLHEIAKEIESIDLSDEQEAAQRGPVEDEAFDSSAV